MPSQPEAQGDILKEFREGTFLSSLDIGRRMLDTEGSGMLLSRPDKSPVLQVRLAQINEEELIEAFTPMRRRTSLVNPK